MSDAATAPAAPDPRVREVLAAAVAALGGQERPGQVEMAEAVAACVTRAVSSWASSITTVS